MSANLHQESARIYQFPAGGRAALGGRRYGENKPATDPAASRALQAPSSEGWYHEEAIREAKPAWER